jgi:hypothetical protein
MIVGMIVLCDSCKRSTTKVQIVDKLTFAELRERLKILGWSVRRGHRCPACASKGQNLSMLGRIH